LEKVRFYLLLGSTLIVGFLLGYVTSAFFPLVRPSPSSVPASPSATATRLSPSQIETALKEGHEALDVGDLQGAWEKYHQVLMTNPHQVEALTHLGIILARSNQLDEAIRLYNRALEFDPNYAHALFDKGLALKDKGDAKGAAEAWNRFLGLVPADSDDAKRVKDWLAELGRSAAPTKRTGTQPEGGT
jgi:tetratricopeptide (TPR) repeat protein